MAVKEFIGTGVMPDNVNDLVIVLIPNIPNPEKVTDFHLISLCNVIYKLVAMCLVSRLLTQSDDIILPTHIGHSYLAG